MPTTDRSQEAAADHAARFTPGQLAYLLGEQRLGRLATADATAAPHVVPVGWSYNRDLGTIDISGSNFASTRKYRNVQTNPRSVRRRRRPTALPTPLRHDPRHRPGDRRQPSRRHRGADPHRPRQDHLLGPGGQSAIAIAIATVLIGHPPGRKKPPRKKEQRDVCRSATEFIRPDEAGRGRGMRWNSSTRHTGRSRATPGPSSSTCTEAAASYSTSGTARSTVRRRCRCSHPTSGGS